jgi:hypothetical protein
MVSIFQTDAKRMSSRIIKKLKPGQPGTLRWKGQFGDRLLCVRYRLDESGERRYTTVEILVDERATKKKTPAETDRKVFLRTGSGEKDIRRKIMEAGGKWNPEESLWMITYNKAKALNLLSRIVKNVHI